MVYSAIVEQSFDVCQIKFLGRPEIPRILPENPPFTVGEQIFIAVKPQFNVGERQFAIGVQIFS